MGVNVYDVLRHQTLLGTQAAIEKVAARLAKPAKGAEA